jgi:hypothetical protein
VFTRTVTHRHCRIVLALEHLEDRTVPSAAHGVHPSLAALVSPHGHHPGHHRVPHHHGHAPTGAQVQTVVTGEVQPVVNVQGQNAPADPAPSAPDPVAQVPSTALLLAGQVSGTWDSQPGVPVAGPDRTYTGQGTVTPLGTVQATGSVQLPGFAVNGQTQGTLTLSNADGSVTLGLVGPASYDLYGSPVTFQYTITGGTGQYAGASGSGTTILHGPPASAPGTAPGGVNGPGTGPGGANSPGPNPPPIYTFTFQPATS